MEEGMNNWRNISLYFGNDTSYSHSYNGRRTRICSVEFTMTLSHP